MNHNERKIVWCYTAGSVVTALGLCVGAWGLFYRNVWALALMVSSILVYAVLRGVAGFYELGDHPEPMRQVTKYYAFASVITALGLCAGAIGMYYRNMPLLGAMVVSILLYAVLRAIAGYYEMPPTEVARQQ